MFENDRIKDNDWFASFFNFYLVFFFRTWCFPTVTIFIAYPPTHQQLAVGSWKSIQPHCSERPRSQARPVESASAQESVTRNPQLINGQTAVSYTRDYNTKRTDFNSLDPGPKMQLFGENRDGTASLLDQQPPTQRSGFVDPFADREDALLVR